MADLRQLAQSILQIPGKVGQWGSENFIYDPATKTPLPGGFVGASSRASKLPMGSKEQINEYIKMAMMAGLTSPKGYTPQITAPIHPIDNPKSIQMPYDLSDFDTAVDLMKQTEKGSFQDLSRATDYVYEVAKKILNPAEFKKYSGKPNTLINVLQKKITPYDTYEKALQKLNKK